jgi:uncharacterized membrane protein
LDNTIYAENDNLLQDECNDFVSEIFEEEELQLHKDIRKRRHTLIGLGLVYIILISASFTVLV